MQGGQARSALAFSPDGQYLAIGRISGATHVRKVEDGAGADVSVLRVSKNLDPKANTNTSTNLNHSHHAPMETEPSLTLGHHLQIAPLKVRVSALAFSPDGKWLASGYNHPIIRLWSIPGGTLERTLEVGGLPSQGISVFPFVEF